MFNPLPDDKFHSSKLKEFADDNFKFDDNGSKLSKRVENTGEKAVSARYEQFLLFPQCFQKACFPGASKGVVWEWVNVAFNSLSIIFQQQLTLFMSLLRSPVLSWDSEELCPRTFPKNMKYGIKQHIDRDYILFCL